MNNVKLAAIKAQEPDYFVYTDRWGTHFTDDKNEFYDSVGIESWAGLYAAPVQQVSVTDGLELIKRMQVCLSLDDTEWGYSAPEKYKLLADIKSYVLTAALAELPQ